MAPRAERACSRAPPYREMEPMPPNILWILTTQWRAAAFGFAGDANARTPHLDTLAAASVRFTEAVTPHPFGPFARAALMTGVPSPLNGVRDYYDSLPEGTRTVAHAMEERGYATAFFGKWHLASRDRDVPVVGDAHARTWVPPERRGGFRFWEGFESGFVLNDPWLHGTRLAEPQRFAGYQSDVLCARAAEFLESWPRPWFCCVSLEAPHPPYGAPAAGVIPPPPASLRLRPNVPLGGEVESRCRRELSGYYAHIEATDRAIGALIERMPQDDTAVIFTSVHGDMHGSHGLFRKGWPHEESVRVPLLVQSPRVSRGSEATLPQGATTDRRPISLLDLGSLTEALAEGRPWELAASSAAISMPSIVPFADQCDRIWTGWRSPTRKAIFNADGSPWLEFNLEHDPLELNPLTPK